MKSNIDKIRETLSQYHRTRSQIMEEAINVRLNKSLMTYDRELNLGVDSISNKSELNVLRKL